MPTDPERPPTVRVATQMPPPACLASYGPFTAVHHGAFGMAVLQHAAGPHLDALVFACRQAFAAGATAGWCSVPRVRAVFFDMDSTVIHEESIVELAAQAGAGEQVAKVTERAMTGELDFRAALQERVALLKGLPEASLSKVAASLTLMDGIQRFVALCQELRVPAFLISGGFVQLAATIVRQVGFSGFHANVLGVENGKLTGTVTGAVVDAEAKRRYLLETCALLGIQPREAAAVGDGANDLPMLTAAGVAVGHRPKPVLVPHVHAVNASGDHGFLAPLLFGRDLPAAGV